MSKVVASSITLEMATKNPSEYANKFRADLIADLELSPSLCCPNCVITYVDGDQEGCCYYSRRRVLNCVFDFDEPISMKEVVREWVYAVLKECRRIGGAQLEAKWRARFIADEFI
jgi:hypothetical protein